MTAVISDCGRYRYTLEREWMTGAGTCLFVMLNPSTADAEQDDPTIRRCIGFAQRWGYQRLTVGNLFALRATEPNALWAAEAPVGPENHRWLFELVQRASLTVCAWGAHGMVGRAGDLQRKFLGRWPHKRVVCLGVTKDGHPRHPLYVRGDFEPVSYPQPSPPDKEAGE